LGGGWGFIVGGGGEPVGSEVTVGHLVDVDIDDRLNGISTRLRYGDTEHVGQLPASASFAEPRTGSETQRDPNRLVSRSFSPWS